MAATPPFAFNHSKVSMLTYIEKTGGVLNMLSFLIWVLKSNIVGISLFPLPKALSFTIYRVAPAGPMFFCAPAYIILKSATLTSRLKISDDMSQIKGILLFGKDLNCVPDMVLFEVMCK